MHEQRTPRRLSCAARNLHELLLLVARHLCAISFTLFLLALLAVVLLSFTLGVLLACILLAVLLLVARSVAALFFCRFRPAAFPLRPAVFDALPNVTTVLPSRWHRLQIE